VGVRFIAGAMGLALLAGCAGQAQGTSRTAVAEPKLATAPLIGSAPSTVAPSTMATSVADSVATTAAPPSAAPTSITLPAFTAKPATPVSSFPGAVNPGLITDNRVFMLGDSVLQSAGPGHGDQIGTLLRALGWVVTMDAEQGRPLSVAVDVLRRRRGEISQVVVVLIGNNYNGDEKQWASQLDTMLSILDGVREVVLLTVEEF